MGLSPQPSWCAVAPALLAPALAMAMAMAMAGCSIESEGAGGSGARAGTGAAGSAGTPSSPNDGVSPVLTIQGDSSTLRLGFGQSVELAVLLMEGDRPLRSKSIAFDLVGRPEDSSLSRLIATTNGEGVARVTLIAATRPVMFSVRATYGATPPVSFTVSVSSSGYGSLIVNAPYRGARAVEERFVLALPGVECDQAEPRDDDPTIVFAPDEDKASLIALPADVTYAVVAAAKSASGATVAMGCTPATVHTQAEDAIDIAFHDQPLSLEQVSSLEVTLEAGSAAAALGSAIRSSISSLVRMTASGQSSAIDAEGRFWLDSLDAVLRVDEDDDARLALADALAAARAQPMGTTPESALASLLEVNDEGAGRASSAVASYVRNSLDSIVLYAEIYAGSDAEPGITLRPLRMQALPLMEGATPPSVRLTSAESAAVDAEVVAAKDTLELHELELSPRLGALATDAFERAVTTGRTGFGDELTTRAGCASLAEWLLEQTFVDASACDDACVEQVCAFTMQRLIDAATAALRAQDEQRPRATLTGSLVLTDDDGDLLAERMQAERIDGLWAPAPDASLGDTLRGTALAHAVSTP